MGRFGDLSRLETVKSPVCVCKIKEGVCDGDEEGD